MSIPKYSDFITESSDYDAMAAIWLEASVAAHGFIPASFWRSNVDNMRQLYLPQTKSIACLNGDGEMTGFLSISGGRHIEALFVKPQEQGRGIGSALLEHTKRSYRELSLCVYEENSLAVNFYLKHGFVVDEKRVDPHTGHAELFMIRTS